MIRVTSLMMCLLLPMAAFADEPIAPSTDAPSQAALVPADEAPQAAAPAVADAKRCGMHGGCAGGGKAKWIVLTGVTATVLAAVAVGVGVSVANSRNGQTVRQ